MLETIFGIISGIITGLGMGGGTVLILLLTIFLQLDQHVAQAVNLVFFIPTSIATILINHKQKIIDYKIAKTTILFGIIGATIGAKIAQKVSSNILKKYFAIFLLIIVIHEIYDLDKLYRNKKNRNNI